MIGAVIGPGGKIIQGIQAETGAVISIDEDEKGGKVEVASNNGESMQAAIAKIKAIVALPEVGETYESTVKSIMPYGCFVEFMPGKEGLLHISEIDWKRYETMEETGIKEGDKIMIKLLEVDEKTGKFRLSAKALKEKPEGYVEPERAPRPERGDRGPRPERRGPRPERRNGTHDFEGDGARLDRRH
jgi:polyribonucleotide nucleotidyltransferase